MFDFMNQEFSWNISPLFRNGEIKVYGLMVPKSLAVTRLG